MNFSIFYFIIIYRINAKRILIPLLSAIFLSAASGMTACSSAQKEKTDKINDYRWVSAEAGLVLRDKPDRNASRIGLIPFAEKVYCTERMEAAESINGVSGSWTGVKWNSSTGWVFGGYLAQDKPVLISSYHDYAWVTAHNGLAIRENYSSDSQKVAVVPSGSRVYCSGRLKQVEEIDGIKGSWTRIEWKKMKGWAFGGHLRSYRPAKMTASLVNLKKAAEKYYTTRSETKNYNSSADDIEITQVLGRYAVVSYKIPVVASDNIVDNEAVWVNINNNWSEFATRFDTGFSATLLYLNNDSRPDLILSDGCCSNGTVRFLLGDKEGGLDEIYFSPSTYYDYYFVTTGRCGDTELAVEDKNTWKNYTYKFDCSTNSVIRTEGDN